MDTQQQFTQEVCMITMANAIAKVDRMPISVRTACPRLPTMAQLGRSATNGLRNIDWRETDPHKPRAK